MKWLFLRSHHFVGWTYPICKSTGSSLSHHFMAQKLGESPVLETNPNQLRHNFCFSAQNVAGQMPSFWCLNHLDQCFRHAYPIFHVFWGEVSGISPPSGHSGPRRVKTPGHIQQAAEARVPVADQRNGGQSAQRAHLEAVMDLLGCVWIDYRPIQGKPNISHIWIYNIKYYWDVYGLIIGI